MTFPQGTASLENVLFWFCLCFHVYHVPWIKNKTKHLHASKNASHKISLMHTHRHTQTRTKETGLVYKLNLHLICTQSHQLPKCEKLILDFKFNYYALFRGFSPADHFWPQYMGTVKRVSILSNIAKNRYCSSLRWTTNSTATTRKFLPWTKTNNAHFNNSHWCHLRHLLLKLQLGTFQNATRRFLFGNTPCRRRRLLSPPVTHSHTRTHTSHHRSPSQCSLPAVHRAVITCLQIS